MTDPGADVVAAVGAGDLTTALTLVTDVHGADELWAVCTAVLDRSDTRFAILLDQIVGWLPADHVARLIDTVMDELSARPALVAVIEQTALQLPQLLERHLVRLWELDPNPRSYTREFPWRGADTAEVNRLLDLTTDGTERDRVIRCLLQAGAVDAIRDRDLIAAPDGWLWQLVGRTAEGRELVSDPPSHLVVPVDRLPSRPAWRRRRHDTWTLTSSSTSVGLGGASDTECSDHGPLRRLLLLQPPPPASVAGSRNRLDLAYCSGCADQTDITFHRHDADGRPSMLPRNSPQDYFEYVELPAEVVGLADTPPRWAVQDWGMSDDRENLNRIGGLPCWIQTPHYEPCPDCGELMAFLAQLDWSSLADAEGMTYLLWCDPCSISAMVYQCT